MINPEIFRKLGVRGVSKGTILLVVFALVLYVGFWAYYWISMREQNEKAKVNKCLEGQAFAFEGEILRVSRYEYDTYMNGKFFGIDIRTADSSNEFITWQFTVNEDRNLLDFIEVGQKVSKVSGSKTFTVTGTNGRKQEFNVPYCN